mgnify:CR=1 FL=1
MPDWTHHLRQRLTHLDLDGGREAEIVEELSQHLDERYEELRRHGSIVRPRLGAEFDDLSPAVAWRRGRGDTQGVLVTGVRSGSLAERMGLQVDDIVVAMNGRVLSGSADLARLLLVWRDTAGTHLTVLRDGRLRQLALN